MRAARVLDAPRTGGIATRALCWRRLGFWLCLGWLLLQVGVYICRYQIEGAKSRYPTWLCGWASSPVHCAASGSVEELELELERRSSRSSGSRHTRWLKQWWI